MVGYGPEDDHFVVELTYNYNISNYKLGNDFQVVLVMPQCTVKHLTDIINFTCMMWNFVRVSASLFVLCTNINQI